ncbi:MAG: hypothetical protein EBX64_12715 [Betaproteobacteria bacterium]|nr:hypothetical protein [Betaproteobacteria bacterium]
MKPFNIEEVKDYILNSSQETKIYLGADSERNRVVHIDGKHGCKIFGYHQRERDYDQRKDKPNIRLMTEVYKVSEIYLELKDVIEDRYVEVHLDINASAKHASNQVVQQAIGYIRGTCNLEALIKPKAFAASYAADRLKFILK